MRQFYKIVIVIFLSFLYWCVPLTVQCQYGFPYNSYGGYWQLQYNQPSPYFSRQIRTNPLTLYNPYQNRMASMNPGSAGQSPYFQQNNPYQFQQNGAYQIGPYGTMNLNSAFSRLASSYLSGNNLYNSSYYGSDYGNVIPYDGHSTYFYLLPNYMLNDPYTLAQQAKRASSNTSAPDY